MSRVFSVLAATLVSALPGFSAGPVRDGHVEAELVTDVAAVVPGGTFTVALRLNHDVHWHTYWVNPGDAGLATDISWKLPEGFSAGAIQWPAPEVTDTGGLKTYGYGGEIFLLVDVTAPASLQPGGDVTLEANASWLMCQDVCMPGEAALSLTLPVAGAPGANARWSSAIAKARGEIPSASPSLAAKAYRTGKDITLVVAASRDLNASAHGFYYFDDTGSIEAGADQTATRAGREVRIGLKQSEYAKSPAHLSGLIRAEGGWFGDGVATHAISFDVVDGAAPGGVAGTAGAEGASRGSFVQVLVLAFLGGLILNLMPCVFPVIGIKIMGFVNQAGEERGRVIAHGLTFAFGVLVSFWTLAGILLALRSGGSQLGWGFQLQSPAFVFVLTVVLLVFGLSMSGVFEIGGSLIGAGAGLQSKGGLAGSFFSGVLATVVATPCAAPMLAPALTAAISLPAIESLLAFTVIGLGLSAPYLLLSAFPGAIKMLPRPGAWMETFKQAMAFLLYGTVAYLVWVVAAQTDGEQFQNLLLGLVAISVACWVLGRWGAIHRRRGVRIVGYVVAALIAAGAFAYGFPGRNDAGSHGIAWEPWSAGRVAELRREGRPVYVDFTARWCVTCQANKKIVFGSSEVRDYFKAHNVATLRGDWTNRDAAITAELERWGQSAVPFNLVYLPGEEPKPLPPVLTPGTVLDAFASLPNGPE